MRLRDRLLYAADVCWLWILNVVGKGPRAGVCCSCGCADESEDCPNREDGVHCDHWDDGPGEVIEVVTLEQWLIERGADEAFVRWAARLTPPDAWVTCHRPDWIAWFAARAGVPGGQVLRALIDLARPALLLRDPRDPLVETAFELARGVAIGRDISPLALRVCFTQLTEPIFPGAEFRAPELVRHMVGMLAKYAYHMVRGLPGQGASHEEAAVLLANAAAAAMHTMIRLSWYTPHGPDGACVLDSAQLGARGLADAIRAAIPWEDVDAAFTRGEV